LLAVGFVALGYLRLLSMAKHKGLRSRTLGAGLANLRSLQLIQKIPVPAVLPGRIDHFHGIPKRRLLIFAALATIDGDCEILLRPRSFRHQGVERTSGRAVRPGLDKIFVANAGSGVVRSLMTARRTLFERVSTWVRNPNTDNLRWDEDSKRVFVGVVGGIAMIDAATETMSGRTQG